MAEEIVPSVLAGWIHQGEALRMIDVRSPSEFAAGHIPGAVNIPLETLTTQACHPGEQVVLLCQGGTRARIAQQKLESVGIAAYVLRGGTAAWASDGRTLQRATATSWSLERQVRLGAGLLVFSGTLLAAMVSTKWLWLTGFVGAGLTFAGLTDICMMGRLLARMPWNRRIA
ncbi:rhodanese-like domain-containing protein [Terriglobus tenax]|uniref:rhodanese-like domain-containing protein n=1 Tax=Terriglobus tenax TaxID=1111115 RepID=UPI0021E01874|nr:rhodanese-like domain-containing protein [Terriglobus tenax]